MSFFRTALSAAAVALITTTALATANGAALEGLDGVGDTRIIGGSPASETYPWMVSLGTCGGALVAPQWVVTAAHCGQPFGVRVGVVDKTAGGERIRVTERIVHPGYAGDTSPGNDIALLKLETPAKSAPIPVAAANGAVGTQTRIMGWGATNPNGGGYPNYLQELNTSITKAERCASKDNTFRDAFEICTDNPGGRSGACFGDSGGPQVKKVNGRWELIGATSRGSQICGQDPSIYTSVPFHADWMNQVSNGAIPKPAGQHQPGTPTPTPTSAPTSTPTTPAPTTTPAPIPTTTTPAPIPTTTNTGAPTNPVKPNPKGKYIGVNVERSGKYTAEVIDSMNRWNAMVPEINFQVATSSTADVRVFNGDGWPYAMVVGLGRGEINMGQQAIDDGFSVTRIALHEFGHILGLPDRKNGDCGTLMSGSSAGTQCTNLQPSDAEIAEVRRKFKGGWPMAALQHTYLPAEDRADMFAADHTNCWNTTEAHTH